MTLLTDAITAYLGPLLKKHAAGEALVFEDLEASHAASVDVLKGKDNAFVSKRVEDLHQTQVQAYREAAVKALRQWAQSEAPLEPMEENDTEDSFVERCVKAVESTWPNWRLDSAKMVVVLEIRKRARATFAKYHPSEEADEGAAAVAKSKNDANLNAYSNGDENNEEEEEEDDDGEVEEDGEMEDDDEDDDGQVEDEPAAKSNEGQKPNNGGDNKKKAPANKNQKKKVTVRKKGTNAKQSGQQRKGGPSNRGRRSGRGGGKAGAAKSG